MNFEPDRLPTVHVAVISHYFVRGRSKDWLRHLLMPLGGLTVIGYVLYEMDAAEIMGACWIVVGLAYFLVPVRARKIRSAGPLDSTPPGCARAAKPQDASVASRLE